MIASESLCLNSSMKGGSEVTEIGEKLGKDRTGIDRLLPGAGDDGMSGVCVLGNCTGPV